MGVDKIEFGAYLCPYLLNKLKNLVHHRIKTMTSIAFWTIPKKLDSRLSYKKHLNLLS